MKTLLLREPKIHLQVSALISLTAEASGRFAPAALSCFLAVVLMLVSCFCCLQSFDRPNIYYLVRYKDSFPSPTALIKDLVDFVGQSVR